MKYLPLDFCDDASVRLRFALAPFDDGLSQFRESLRRAA